MKKYLYIFEDSIWLGDEPTQLDLDCVYSGYLQIVNMENRTVIVDEDGFDSIQEGSIFDGPDGKYHSVD